MSNNFYVFLQCLEICSSQDKWEEIFSPPYLHRVRAEFDSKVQQDISEVLVPKGRFLKGLWEGAQTEKNSSIFFLSRCSNRVPSTLGLFAFLESLSTLALFSSTFQPSMYLVINS